MINRTVLAAWMHLVQVALLAALCALMLLTAGCIEPARAPEPTPAPSPAPVPADAQLAGEIRAALGGDRQAARDYGDVMAGMAEMVQSSAVTDTDKINDALIHCKEALGQSHRESLVPIFERTVPSVNPPRDLDAASRAQIAGEFKRFSAALLEAAK